jgi:acyl carrier protein
MDTNKALGIVRQAISSQFGVSIETISPDTVALDVPGWDSFSNGLLIMALEDAAGQSLPFDELAGADDVAEMARILAENA